MFGLELLYGLEILPPMDLDIYYKARDYVWISFLLIHFPPPYCTESIQSLEVFNLKSFAIKMS